MPMVIFWTSRKQYWDLERKKNQLLENQRNVVQSLSEKIKIFNFFQKQTFAAQNVPVDI